jgi:hypothetical protein
MAPTPARDANISSFSPTKSSTSSTPIEATSPGPAVTSDAESEVEPVASSQIGGSAPAVPTNIVKLPPPTHVLPGFTASTVRRGPGRPRKVRPAPLATEADYDAAVRAALRQHVDSDAVVGATELRENSAALLRALVLATAREAAGLAYDITYTIKDQRSLERARSRRIDALAVIAKLVLEARRAEAGSPDVPLHVQRRVTNALVEELGRVAAEALGVEAAERLMSGFRARIAGSDSSP